MARASPGVEPAGMALTCARCVRCCAVALVPLAGFGALPKILQLQRKGAECLKPSLQHESWRACYSNPGAESGLLDALHYMLAVWVTLQFMYNFVKSCFEEPGAPERAGPKEGRWLVEASEPQLGSYEPRWCESCQLWKPPRCHHSKRLNQCVLRMDHYCVITENVIGQRNHGYFVLMVLFGLLGLAYALLMVGYVFWLAWKPYWELFSLLANYARKRGSYYQWLLLGGHLHVLKALLGSEITVLLVLTITALFLLLPLLRHVRLAFQGITVLETLKAPIIQLPGSKVFCLEPGDYRSTWREELAQLLGPCAWWRLA
ncbi:Palmitoyltransferase PFA4 (Protein S-acyltransferase) (PAT) (Protein fatty acyltransferase 4) [Durusdinium trenchii]|uniref:Palmitoyltransferase n=1 Tax=Durusdinium trenchii TaxID=1381693 RepID=A0ABP0JIN7_9DINO